MEIIKTEKGIKLQMSSEEHIVLLEWLYRFNELDDDQGLFEHKSEQIVLWHMEALLESELDVLFSDNYLEVLQEAREKIGGREE